VVIGSKLALASGGGARGGTASQQRPFRDELLSAGYSDQMIVGRLVDSAELIGLAWQQWRHQPVAVEEKSDEQVA